MTTSSSRNNYCSRDVSNPSTSELHRLAECGHFSEDPGIDAKLLSRQLEKLGFSDVEIHYHWMGKHLSQLPRIQRALIYTFLSINSLNKDVASHFSIIAKKG
jgi:hypothetical protein